MTSRLVSDKRTRLFDWRTAVAESELASTTKLVALVLSLHMNKAGESCFPGLPLLIQQTSLSRAGVARHLTALVGSHWIERQLRPGRGYGTLYTATFPPQLVDEIIANARPAGLADSARTREERVYHVDASAKQLRKVSERSQKGLTGETALSIEDGRTGGREDVKATSTNVLGTSSRVDNQSNDLTDGQIMRLVRQHLYGPDGKAPAGYDDGRDVLVIQALRKSGRSGYDIAAAIEGLALLRDRGELTWKDDDGRPLVTPGGKLTMRALFGTRTGVRPVFMLAEETYHKHAARRRDAPAGTGMTPIGDVLRQVMG